jgi:hypothetical protein
VDQSAPQRFPDLDAQQQEWRETLKAYQGNNGLSKVSALQIFAQRQRRIRSDEEALCVCLSPLLSLKQKRCSLAEQWETVNSRLPQILLNSSIFTTALEMLNDRDEQNRRPAAKSLEKQRETQTHLKGVIEFGEKSVIDLGE